MNSSIKSLIYKSLQKIGLNGFGGNVVSASNMQKALEEILLDVLAHESLPSKQKVYRNLLRQNLIYTAKELENEYRITVTPAGAYRLSKESLDLITIPPMSAWDNKWRVISYDLPSGKKSERYELTKHLVRMGFVPLQKSMWVHPYVCFDQIDLLADALLIKRYITILEVSKLDDNTTNKLLKTFQTMLNV